MIKTTVRNLINNSISDWAKSKNLESLPGYALEMPPKNIDADLACNIAMLLSKLLKNQPRKIAEDLIPLIKSGSSGVIASIEIAGAGFLNIRLSDSYLHGKINEILKNTPLQTSSDNKEKILIEFVSANPTGPLHIGHGRGAAIGDSLARVFKYLGYNIEREYYLNDVGNQMEMLGKSVEARYLELKGENIEFPENGYKGDYIKDVAKKVIDNPREEIDFKKLALKEIGATIENDLKLFDVSFDNWFSESVLTTAQNNGKTKVDEACEYLKSKDFAYEQDGALWFKTTSFGDEKDRVLKRSDGRYTYLASDVAYHKNKIDRGYTKMIDIWGADHHGYVPRMKAAVQTLGRDKDDLVVILYQLVALMRNGQPVAMSTRSGEFITLEEVLNEVGKDACRFFFLLRAPDSHLDFDLELAKKQSKENPVFYVQYVHARCCSLFKEAEKTSKVNIEQADLNFLKTPYERDLIKKMCFLPDILELCVKSLSPHHLTTYLMETADLYHRFYENCRVLGEEKELTLARLALVKATAQTVKNALAILGVSAPEKM